MDVLYLCSMNAIKRETIHNQHRRSFWHDYYQKGLYMVTMVVEGRKRLFGTIEGSTKGRPGTDEAPHMALSELGWRVLEQEVPKIHHFYPEVEVWQVAMMPDHIHLLLYVREPLSEGKHLGQVIRGFKTGCSRAWWQWQDDACLGGKAAGTTVGAASTAAGAAGTTAGAASTTTGAAVPKASPVGKGQLRPVLFEKGYHDRIINKRGMLENIKRYMTENPLRARIREECPHLMERQLHLWIAGRSGPSPLQVKPASRLPVRGRRACRPGEHSARAESLYSTASSSYPTHADRGARSDRSLRP